MYRSLYLFIIVLICSCSRHSYSPEIEDALRQAGSNRNELLSFVYQDADGAFKVTSPAKFLDLQPPVAFAKKIEPPAVVDHNDVIAWAFGNVVVPLYEDTKAMVEADAAKRKEYMETAFSRVIMDIDTEINELQGKVFLGNNNRVQEKLLVKTKRKEELLVKKQKRLEDIGLMLRVNPKAPEVLGCAYVVPLSRMEYEQCYGMKRDDEVEAIAMQVAMDYEKAQGENATRCFGKQRRIRHSQRKPVGDQTIHRSKRPFGHGWRVAY